MGIAHIHAAAPLRLAVLLALFMSSSPARADAYPSRAVTLVSPSQAGSVVDNISRIIGVRLAALWGQSVVVEAKGGAGGVVGTNVVATAQPNGHTLLLGSNGTHAINATLYPKLPYDPVKAFAPVVQVGTSHLLVVVAASSRINSIAELITAAKERRAGLTFGSGGSGTTPHLAGELFKTMAKVNMVHVPYKGSPQSLTDLRAGRIDVIFASAGTAIPLVRSGELKALGITTLARDPDMPDVPTVSEQGLAGFEATQWFGVFAPAATPREVISKVQADVARVVAGSDVAASLKGIGITPQTSSTAAFDKFANDEIAKWGRLVKQSGATAD